MKRQKILTSSLFQVLLLCCILFGSCPLFVSSVEAANVKEEESYCTREEIVDKKEGDKLTLAPKVNSLSLLSCYVLFTQRGTECQSCYGTEDVCENVKNTKSREKQKCPQEKKYSVTKDAEGSSHCLLTIKSIGGEDTGLYQFFETKGARIQACHVYVEVAKTNPWKVASLCLAALLSMTVFLLCKLITTKEMSSICEGDCEKETSSSVEPLIRFKLRK